MAKKKKSINPSTSSELLSLATERVAQKNLSTDIPALSTTSSSEEMLRLIHKLEVHQVELELQQEELARTRTELEESLSMYKELYDFAPVGYLTLSRDRKIQQANLTAARLLGVDRSLLQGMNFMSFVLPEDNRVIDALLKTVCSKKVSENCELKLMVSSPSRHKSDHSIHTFHIEAAVSDATNACRIILSDITAQKVAEEGLRKSERNFRSITEQMADEVFVIDSIGTLTYVSPVVEKLFGYLPHEVLGRPFTDYMLVEDIPEALQVFNSTLQHKTANQIFEVRLKRKDSSLFDGEIHLQYYQDQDISGMIGLIRDISDRKLAESKAREMITRYEATIDAAQIGTWDWNVQTGEVIFNNRWFEIVGYSPEELAHDSIQTSINLAHPDDFKESRAIAEKHFNGELPYYEIEYRMKHKNGHWVWFLDRGRLISRTADGKPLQMLGTHIDITERKQAEQAMRESERKFRSITEQISEVVFVNNSIGEVSYVSPVVEKITGYKPDELLGHSFFEYLAEEEIPRATAIFTDAMSRQLTNQVVELTYRKKDGSLFQAEIHSQYFKDNGSSGVIGLLRDISERKLIENQLVKLSTAVEQSPAVVLITDAHGTIEYVNPMFTELTGYSIEEAKGRNPRILQSGLTPKSVYDELWKTILSGRIWRGEWQNKKKNGELFWESVVISAILNGEGVITNFVAVKEDITERKKMLEELIVAKEKAEESDRLKSAFLANISHEIRTPMNGILGFSELLKEPHLSGEEMSEFIELIQKSGHRMLNLINDLIDISCIDAEETKVEIREIPLNDLMRDIHTFFKPDARSKELRLTFTTGLSDNESLIKTDSGKLTRVLTNLINNALKFTMKGGVDFGYSRKENTLEFYVIDSGIGIPVEMQDKVFDRFHQVDNSLTRGYEGAGLGLSISKALIKILGGTIHVESIDGA